MNLKNIQEILNNNKFNLIHLRSTTSTMDEAKLYLEKIKNNLVVFSDKQTKGRGRRGKDWISPLGNIYCSIVSKNSISLDKYFIFSMITSLAVKKTLESLGVNKIEFKWPNDIYFQNKKFGGMILESYNLQNDEKYVIIGLGINFSSSPFLNSYKTTYIREFSDIKNISFFLENFLKQFFCTYNYYINENNDIISEFKKSLMFLNKRVEIAINDNQNKIGIFKGIKNDGSLILENRGKFFSVYSGSIKYDCH